MAFVRFVHLGKFYLSEYYLLQSFQYNFQKKVKDHFKQGMVDIFPFFAFFSRIQHTELCPHTQIV